MLSTGFVNALVESMIFVAVPFIVCVCSEPSTYRTKMGQPRQVLYSVG